MGEFLEASLALRQGAFALDARFALSAPWTCLFGASGSGKSTILRAVAGIVRPERGRIVLRTDAGREQVLFDGTHSISRRVNRRGVRMAAQQAWLFPGTVGSNLAYGAAAASADELTELAERLRLGHLMEADVRALSGGERQRVSLARAVAAAVYSGEQVGLLLLDEPFAGMDTRLRDELAVELRDWLRAVRLPVLSVTHDVGEAFLLGAEVIRIADGKVVAQGRADEVLAEEQSRLRAILSKDVHAR